MRLSAPRLSSNSKLRATSLERHATTTESRSSYLLFLTHHLLSHTKQTQLRTWYKDLSLIGFVKRGYPGVILFAAAETTRSHQGGQTEGQPTAHSLDSSSFSSSAVCRLEEVGRRIKRMQWASQDLRPVHPLSSLAFESLQKVLRDQSGHLLSEAEKDQTQSASGKMPPMMVLDSMREISALFEIADKVSLGTPDSAQRRKSAVVDGQKEERWRDIWKREMKPK